MANKKLTILTEATQSDLNLDQDLVYLFDIEADSPSKKVLLDTFKDVFFRDFINNRTTSYTLQLTDRNKHVVMNSTSDMDLTVPSDSSVGFRKGTIIPITQFNTGQVNVVAGTGVTIDTPKTLSLLEAGAKAKLWKIDTNRWLLTGALVE